MAGVPTQCCARMCSEGSVAALDEREEGGWKAVVLPAGGEFQDEAQGVGFEGVRGVNLIFIRSSHN